jgi:hypothetical protein
MGIPGSDILAINVDTCRESKIKALRAMNNYQIWKKGSQKNRKKTSHLCFSANSPQQLPLHNQGHP